MVVQIILENFSISGSGHLELLMVATPRPPAEFLHIESLLAMMAASIIAWYELCVVKYLIETDRVV